MKQQHTATLYIFSGLPGAGKSTLAKLLAKQRQAQWLRVDTIEQMLKDNGQQDFDDTGYQVAFAIARDNLKLGFNVVAIHLTLSKNRELLGVTLLLEPIVTTKRLKSSAQILKNIKVELRQGYRT